MKQVTLTIRENEPLNSNTFKAVLTGNIGLIQSGSFINIKVPDFYLRRPISVADFTADSVTIVYRVLGGGTQRLSQMTEGEELDVLVGLGKGFNLLNGQKPLLVGGGLGTPPMYALAKRLVAMKKKPIAVLGFNTAKEIIMRQDFEKLGVQTVITTVDGSYGEKGFVTDILHDFDYDYFYACGPEPMLKALVRTVTVDGEVSLEERMACGFGACMCCSIMTKNGAKRVCKDGPVFKKEELLW